MAQLNDSDVNLKVTFDYTKSPKEFIFEDVTDYASKAISKTVAKGIIKVVHKPTNTTVYENTNFSSPDIDPDVSTTAGLNLNIPTDNNNNPLKGEYEFTYTVRISGGSISNSYDVEEVKTYDHQYDTPTGNVELEVSCTKPEIKSVDKTGYTVKSVTPSITRKKDDDSDGHIIEYPGNVTEADKTGTTRTISSSTLYTLNDDSLQYYSRLTSQLDYDYGDDVHVKDKITASATKDVQCGNICDLYCCIKDQRSRVDRFKSKNRGKYLEELDILSKMIEYGILIDWALKCDKGADIDTWTTKILELGNCESGCGCNDGEPQLVQGLGLSSQDVDVQEGSGIKVTESTSGDTTVWTVSLDATLNSKLNTIRESALSEGDGISISKSSSGYTDTYTISIDIQNSDLSTWVAAVYELDFSTNAGTAPTITKQAESKYGGTASGTLSLTDEIWAAGSNVQFRITSPTSNGTHFAPNIDILKATNAGGVNIGDFYELRMSEYDESNSTIKFGIVDRTDGSFMTGNSFAGFIDKMTIAIKIGA